MKTLKIAGYDLETTGFLEPEHRIIEICIMTYEFEPASNTRRLVDNFTQRIHPLRNVPEASSRVHGIYIEDLNSCPTWEAVAPDVCKRLDAADIGIAHNNIGFDAPFLIQELERVKLPIPDFDPFDTMTEGRWSTAYGKVPSLQELCFACGVEYDTSKAHSADYDVRVMMDCFFYGIKHGYFSL